MRLFPVAVAAALFSPVARAAEPVDYLKDIKPILAERCYACHSALRQQSDLRLDTAELIRRGGDSGAAIEPGKSADSLLVQMITAEPGSRMPPEEEGEALGEREVALIRAWIDQGALAPDEPLPPDPREHWSFQPPRRPPLPEVRKADWVRNPIDAFIAAEHEARGLVPVGPADRSVLLRRVYLDMIGLPPTPDELRAFLADDSPGAYESVVERLLESPQYGERWGRHWMDVWRYSDWSGYREEIRNSARHIWRWRDWIIESLNEDKGYDRMVLEMVAGDEIAPDDLQTLRATGFLARNWYKFNRNTWLDDTVEHTTKAFLGITINCARCHDHKYDPISQAEYYRLRAIFEPHELRTDRVPGEADPLKDGLPRVADLKPDVPTYLFIRGNEKQPDQDHPLAPGVPAVLGDELAIEPVEMPLPAWYPALREFALQEDLDQAAQKVAQCKEDIQQAPEKVAAAQKKVEELTAASASADQDEAAKKQADEMLKAARAELAAAEAAAGQAEAKLAVALAEQAALVARIDADKARYGVARQDEAEGLALAAGRAERALAVAGAELAEVAARQELDQAKAAVQADDEKTAKAVADAEKKLADSSKRLEDARAALDKPGSNYRPLGTAFPQTSTGRRLAFARWLTDRDNPLTARVAVNHIWLRHFGSPLVDNVFDFGLRSTSARNQALLDWLAVELMDNGWRMKHVHRLIVTSTTFRMQSGGAGASPSNIEADRDNRYLWRMNTRRLEAELVRDAVLHVAGNLDLSQGGPEIDHQAGLTTPRRSIYFRHAYEKQMKFLELFDAASVNECYRRSESILPQQALALANSQLSLEQSRLLARRLSGSVSEVAEPDAAFVRLAFEHILSRQPAVEELEECREFLSAQSALLAQQANLTQFGAGQALAVAPAEDPALRAKENLVQVLLNHNDFVTIR